MQVLSQGGIPIIGIENPEELEFAKSVFKNLEGLEPDDGKIDYYSAFSYLDNADHLRRSGRRVFPVLLVDREATVAHHFMTHESDASSIFEGPIEDIGSLAINSLYPQAA